MTGKSTPARRCHPRVWSESPEKVFDTPKTGVARVPFDILPKYQPKPMRHTGVMQVP
ncbi:hypothetical protein KJ039_11165 [bacterium]|nr:hypothetical protein [bacterium]